MTVQAAEATALGVVRGTLDWFADADHFVVGMYAQRELTPEDHQYHYGKRLEATQDLTHADRTCLVGGLMKVAGYDSTLDVNWDAEGRFGSALLLLARRVRPLADCVDCQRTHAEFSDACEREDSPELFAEEVLSHMSDEHGLEMVRETLARTVGQGPG